MATSGFPQSKCMCLKKIANAAPNIVSLLVTIGNINIHVCSKKNNTIWQLKYMYMTNQNTLLIWHYMLFGIFTGDTGS